MASSILGPKRYEAIVDGEKFEKEVYAVLQKALRDNEEPPKEKHVRKTLIATWRDKGCSVLWKNIKQFPILRSHVICWKMCFVVHRSFRDGHPDVVKQSRAHMRLLGDIGKHWSRSVAGYAPLNTAYIKVLMTRISFVVKNPEISPTLIFDDKPFTVPTDIDHAFQLAVEVFDVQSSLLHLYAEVMTKLDPSHGVSAIQIQCKLAPLVPAIQDSAAMYDVIFKLMKALHTSLPADTLKGHRERFNRQYHALRKYFHEASKMKYLQTLVKIPSLSPDPPSFLLPGQLIEEELAKQVQRLSVVDEEASLTSIGQFVSTAESSESPPITRRESDQFTRTFGQGGFEEGFDFHAIKPPQRDEKDQLIEQLMREIVDLREKIADLEGQLSADNELMGGLRERLAQLEAELNDYKEIAEQTCNENVLLKKTIEAAGTEKGAVSESEARAKAAEDKFTKLRVVYQKLRTDHISSLRTNTENAKKLQTASQDAEGIETEKQDLEMKVLNLTLELDEVKVQASDESAHLSVLREELRMKEARSVELEQAQRSLSEQLQAKADSAPHTLVVDAVEEAESLIQKVLEQLSSPAIAGTTCTPEFLLSRTKNALDVIDNTTSTFSLYNNDPSAVGKAVSSLSSLVHCLGEVILQGVATSHMAPSEDQQKLTQASRSVGEDALQYLSILKQEKPGSGTIAAGANSLQKTIRTVERLAGDLAPGQEAEDKDSDALENILDEEMASTALAVEEAAMRIQAMLLKSREDDTGVELQVNEGILDSCTQLMKAIKVLITRSKELQLEIVSEGMGTHTDVGEFYKKNSRWSEGLISAAKQVGWGASVLVDAADKVVQQSGKLEELEVASHDIAASTAQLVAASRVKARPKSDKLKGLKASSRNVSEATGQVVASAHSAADLRRNSAAKPDYSKLSLTQAKRLEMESQVKALELEKELEMERTRLAELRKIHYHLAGASEGWEEVQQ